MNSLPAIALLTLNFVLGFQDVSIKKEHIKSEDNYKYISISLWRPFIDVERSSRISASQQASERQKLISAMALHWKQEGDLLSFDGLGPSIETQRNFTDFDLSFEWKIPPKADFAIFLKGVPGPHFGEPPQGASEKNKKGSGGLFLNKRFSPYPSLIADLPPENWNRTRIRMRGDRVTVWLNGQQVVEGIPLENSWDRRKPVPIEGPIGLQGRGTPFQVRNMTIHPLEP